MKNLKDNNAKVSNSKNKFHFNIKPTKATKKETKKIKQFPIFHAIQASRRAIKKEEEQIPYAVVGRMERTEVDEEQE